MIDYQHEKEKRDAKVEAEKEYITTAIEFLINDLTNYTTYNYSLDRKRAINVIRAVIKELK